VFVLVVAFVANKLEIVVVVVAAEIVDVLEVNRVDIVVVFVAAEIVVVLVVNRAVTLCLDMDMVELILHLL